MSHRVIRLIPYQEYDAITNMAIDEALLELHLAGKTPATLRFYGWAPPAVSFGYAQKVSERTLLKVRSAGYDAVRRPTGGRAVLHENELTYCFVGAGPNEETSKSEDAFWLDQGSPYEGFLPPSIAQAYKEICDALIYGFSELGVETSLGRSNSSYQSYEDCFQATTQADLQHDGKKIAGSAQLRRKHGVLQHGSIMVNQSQTRLAEIFGIDQKQELDGEEKSERHCNLVDIMKEPYDRTRLEEAIGRGFARKFSCQFAVYELTEEELAFVDELKADSQRYQFAVPSPTLDMI